MAPRAPKRAPTQIAEIGRRVRALRNRQGMTQEELAERCGLHRTYIGHLERGEVNPTVSNLLRLSLALEIDAGDLIRRLPG